MTVQAKKRIRRSGDTIRRNLPKLREQTGRQRKLAPADQAIMLSVAKNLEALRTLARE